MTASLYIHIPFCKKKCDYCDFFSIGEEARRGTPDDLSDSYIDSLVEEARLYADFYKISEWRTVYVGGGTPSLLSGGQISHLISGIKKIARVGAETEITVEMNPDDVRADFLESCGKAGVNRISVGIQAIDDDALRAVNRGSSVKIILRALGTLRERWRGRLSVDFIAGLPNHTWRSFRNQFAVLENFTNIDHVSLYTLTVEEGTPLWSRIERGETAFSEEKADRMWLSGRNILEKMGFSQYEVSNFAREGFESLHNGAYWGQESYVGVGAGAVGTIYDFAEKSAVRWTNTLSVPDYIAGVRNQRAECDSAVLCGRGAAAGLPLLRREIETLDENTLEFEFLMLGFRKLAGVASEDFGLRFGKSLSERLGAERADGVFARWRKMRLAAARESCGGGTIYSLNRRGILLLNRFLEELM